MSFRRQIIGTAEQGPKRASLGGVRDAATRTQPIPQSRRSDTHESRHLDFAAPGTFRDG